MKKKLYILLEDDNEILGNGGGHIMLRQYLPTKKYIDILNKYKIKGTFYIDMAQYLFMLENKSKFDYQLQIKVFKETIKLLLDNGMDIQLHIHSQWLNAQIIDKNIIVTEKWNIGQLAQNEQLKLFKECHSKLEEILKGFGSKEKIISYKAGSWGIQPIKSLHGEFVKNGIKLVLGPVKDLKINKLGINYTEMQINDFPYYVSKNNVNHMGNNDSGLVILPLTETFLGYFDLVRYLVEKSINKIFNPSLDLDLPLFSKNFPNPIKGKDKFRFRFYPFKTHLKINAQKFWYLKKTFNRSYKFLMKNPHKEKIMVIETHTKDFMYNSQDIDKFFSYIFKKYNNIEFITSKKLVKLINEKNIIPKSNDD